MKIIISRVLEGETYDNVRASLAQLILKDDLMILHVRHELDMQAY